MGKSKTLSEKIERLTPDEKDRLVRMGWEDRTSFEAIRMQFDFSPNEFVRFMRTELAPKAFQSWRKRVHEQGHLKNERTRGFTEMRFKCSRQSIDGITKGKK